MKLVAPPVPHPSHGFPLQCAQEHYYGHIRVANECKDTVDRPDRAARRERHLAMAEHLRLLRVPCPQVYPRAWRRLACDLPPSCGAIVGVVLGLGLRFYRVFWPLALCAAWCVNRLAGAMPYGGAIVDRGMARAETDWAALAAETARPTLRCGPPRGRQEHRLERGAAIAIAPTGADTTHSIARMYSGRHYGSTSRVEAMALVYVTEQPRTAEPETFTDLSDGARGWLGQMQESLIALRFPNDLGQARAAVKFGSRFDWMRSPHQHSVPPLTRTEVMEGIAIVPHCGNLLVVNIGRCAAFLQRRGEVTPLALPQHRDAPRHAQRRDSAQRLWPESSAARGLSAAPPCAATRPEVTCIAEAAAAGGRIVLTTPGTLEALGAAAWTALLADSASLTAKDATELAVSRIAAAGLSTAFAIFTVDVGVREDEALLV